MGHGPLKQPERTTQRLRLRGVRLEDAPAVKLLAGDFAVADTTANIPHPYETGMAEQWMADREHALAGGCAVTCAVALLEQDDLVGAIGMSIDWANARGDVGYWVGRPYWNQGYASEALAAMLSVAFEDLKLRRVQAMHLIRNPASGRVMAKCGMQREAVMQDYFRKWDKFEDAAQYAILASQWGQS